MWILLRQLCVSSLPEMLLVDLLSQINIPYIFHSFESNKKNQNFLVAVFLWSIFFYFSTTLCRKFLYFQNSVPTQIIYLSLKITLLKKDLLTI